MNGKLCRAILYDDLRQRRTVRRELVCGRSSLRGDAPEFESLFVEPS